MMVLYDYWRSSASYRVRITLNMKGVDYEQRSVDLAAGAQSEDAYRTDVNAQGFVPTLVHRDLRLTQSLAIIEYLEETIPEPALLPSDPADRARVRALSQIIACDIHPLNNLRIFLSGERPGLADICLVPQMYNARRFKVDLTPYPTLVKIDEACQGLETFARAVPENQPDARAS